MKCPRCENSTLDERERDGVTVDVCRQCRGIWLDRSELERIVARALREQSPAELAAPPLPAHTPPRAPGGYDHRDDDMPPHGQLRRKQHWFESLTDNFD